MSDGRCTFRIHPAIGFARVGNSPDAWYLEPTAVAALPTERDADGIERPVTQFKSGGLIKRQAARFRVYRHEPGQDPVEVSTGNGVRSVKWTVHVANKKAAWYQFQELQGNVMLGTDNTYENQGVPLRNSAFVTDAERQKLITDPGPRTLTEPGDWIQLDAASAGDYPHVNFPPVAVPDSKLPVLPLSPYPVNTLGAVSMTERGELLVLGGFGNAGGPGTGISTFAGADGWYDDIADGPVTAEVETDDGQVLKLGAWVVTGAPKLAPELANIASLADTLIDVGVRLMGLCPALYRDGSFQPDYVVCYERDVFPIFKAMKDTRWVANVDAMVSLVTPPFDLTDFSEENRANREAIFSMFRDPENGHKPDELASSHQRLFADNGFPLMPMNSGDNSISNTLIEKFMSVTPTQYNMLRQWAAGKCISRRQDPNAGRDWDWADAMDIATAGNAVGEPMAPGIEVTWTLRNPIILTPGDPLRILPENADYSATGLSPSRDETLTGGGCQPGDLTKRMAIPWQADFFDCSVQNVNFTTPSSNKIISNLSRIPLAPTFFSYWWPAQSPYNVYEGATTVAEQMLDGNAFIGNNNVGQSFGQNVMYHRGLNSFVDSVVGWKYLGFVLNRTTGPYRDVFQFFVEEERNYEAFQAGYYGLAQDGEMYTTQEAVTTTTADLNNNRSQNVFPVMWLIGN